MPAVAMLYVHINDSRQLSPTSGVCCMGCLRSILVDFVDPLTESPGVPCELRRGDAPPGRAS